MVPSLSCAEAVRVIAVPIQPEAPLAGADSVAVGLLFTGVVPQPHCVGLSSVAPEPQALFVTSACTVLADTTVKE